MDDDKKISKIGDVSGKREGGPNLYKTEMHVTEYDTLEQVVAALGSQETNTQNDSQMNVTLITVQHDKVEKIMLDYSFLTPRSWYQFYSNALVCVLNTLDLDKIHQLICREVLRIQMKKLESGGFSDPSSANGNMFIVDGFVACVSIIFSQFVSHERIDYDQLNFRKLYLILDRLKELDGLIGGNVRINESGEIWEVVGKIFVPCHKESSYVRLVEYLTGTSVDRTKEDTQGRVLGSEEFVCLRHIFEFFGIKRISRIEEK